MEKVCPHHESRGRRFLRSFCATFLVIALIALLVFFITWAILQPKKPRFTLQDATIFTLNVTAPNVISTVIQVTVYSRNPNARIGIYYDRMNVYAVYNNQQITYFSSINAVYQGHKDVNVWSPFVYGYNVPVAPYNGPALILAKGSGVVPVVIKIDGRIKWKVGTVTTGHYHLHVTCRADIPYGTGQNSANGIVIQSGIKYTLSQSCSVSV